MGPENYISTIETAICRIARLGLAWRRPAVADLTALAAVDAGLDAARVRSIGPRRAPAVHEDRARRMRPKPDRIQLPDEGSSFGRGRDGSLYSGPKEPLFDVQAEFTRASLVGQDPGGTSEAPPLPDPLLPWGRRGRKETRRGATRLVAERMVFRSGE